MSVVAWRRLGDIPDDPLPWLLVVARNTLADQRRTFARHDQVQLETAALEQLVSSEPAVDDVVIARATMLGALESFTSTYSGSSTVDSVPAGAIAKTGTPQDNPQPAVASGQPTTCTWNKHNR
jgi:hypothetical protein